MKHVKTKTLLFYLLLFLVQQNTGAEPDPSNTNFVSFDVPVPYIFTNRLGVSYQTRYITENLSNAGVAGWAKNEFVINGDWRFYNFQIAGKYSQYQVPVMSTDNGVLSRQDSFAKLNLNYIWNIEQSKIELATGLSGFRQQIQPIASTQNISTGSYLDQSQIRNGAGLDAVVGWSIDEPLILMGSLSYYPFVQNIASGGKDTIPDRLQLTTIGAGVTYRIIPNLSFSILYEKEMWGDFSGKGYSSGSDCLSVGVNIQTDSKPNFVTAYNKPSPTPPTPIPPILPTLEPPYVLTEPSTPPVILPSPIETPYFPDLENMPDITLENIPTNPNPTPNPLLTSNEFKPSIFLQYNESEYGEYTVQKGDSLIKIAYKVLGNGNRWKELYNINKDKIKKPPLILPGQKLRIPKWATLYLSSNNTINTISNTTKLPMPSSYDPGLQNLQIILEQQVKQLQDVKRIQAETNDLYLKLSLAGKEKMPADEIIKMGQKIAQNEEVIKNSNISDPISKSMIQMIDQRLQRLQYIQQLRRDTGLLYNKLSVASQKGASPSQIIEIANQIATNEKILKEELPKIGQVNQEWEELSKIKSVVDIYYKLLSDTRTWQPKR